MNHRIGHCSWFVAGVLLFILPTARAHDDRPFRNLFEEARERSDIKAKEMPGFILRGAVRIWVKKDAASSGKYLFVWTPEGKWKEQIAFPGYTRTRIGDGKQFWQVRSTESESPSIFEMRNLIGASRPPRLPDTDKLEKTRPQIIDGGAAECINRRISAAAAPWSYCFDPKTGDLLKAVAAKESSEVSWKVQVMEFSNFQEWAHKRVPRTLRGYNGKQTVVEVQLQEIKALPQLPQEYFSVPKEATSWLDCSEGQPWKLKDRVQPAYPTSSRSQHHQGTVVLYAVIGEDGRLSELRLAHSAGPDLDRSALEAVSQWRYERTSACSSFEGRSETLIDVVYTLNL